MWITTVCLWSKPRHRQEVVGGQRVVKRVYHQLEVDALEQRCTTGGSRLPARGDVRTAAGDARTGPSLAGSSMPRRRMPDLSQSVQTVVRRCLAVKPGEEVLVIVDPATGPIGEALRDVEVDGAAELAQHGDQEDRAGDAVDGVVAVVRQIERHQHPPAVRVRARAHAPVAARRQRGRHPGVRPAAQALAGVRELELRIDNGAGAFTDALGRTTVFTYLGVAPLPPACIGIRGGSSTCLPPKPVAGPVTGTYNPLMLSRITPPRGRTIGFGYDGGGRVTASGVWAPRGQARAVDGGVVVSGRSAFCSGITHPDLLFAGCVVPGEPRPSVVALPKADLAALAPWHTLGPRVSMVYDLLGNGRTAAKFAAGSSQGRTLDQVISTLGHVAEGVHSARAARDHARQRRIEMPITEAVWVRDQLKERFGQNSTFVSIGLDFEVFQPRLVIVDPVTSLITVGTEAESKAMLVRLMDYLKSRMYEDPKWRPRRKSKRERAVPRRSSWSASCTRRRSSTDPYSVTTVSVSSSIMRNERPTSGNASCSRSRAICSAPMRWIGLPSRRTSPRAGRTRPLMVRSVVVLPAPLLPIRLTIWPRSTLKVTPRTAWIAP